MQCRVCFLSILLVFTILLPLSAAQVELTAKSIGIYEQIAPQGYLLNVIIIADQDCKINFRLKIFIVSETGDKSINITGIHEFKEGENPEVRFEVPDLQDFIKDIREAYLEFKEEKESEDKYRNMEDTSGKIESYKNKADKVVYFSKTSDVKISALDDKEVSLYNKNGVYEGDISIRSTQKAQVRFRLVFVGGSGDGKSVNLPGGPTGENYDISAGDSTFHIKSDELKQYKDTFNQLKLDYKVEDKDWETVKDVKGREVVLSVQEVPPPPPPPTSMNVHITEVNGEKLKDGVVNLSLQEGKPYTLTLQIILDSYNNQPFNAKVEYKTDNDVNFIPNSDVKIDGKVVVHKVTVNWVKTNNIAIHITASDPWLKSLTGLASVTISPVIEPEKNKFLTWMTNNYKHPSFIIVLLFILLVLVVSIGILRIKKSRPKQFNVMKDSRDKGTPKEIPDADTFESPEKTRNMFARLLRFFQIFKRKSASSSEQTSDQPPVSSESASKQASNLQESTSDIGGISGVVDQVGEGQQKKEIPITGRFDNGIEPYEEITFRAYSEPSVKKSEGFDVKVNKGTCDTDRVITTMRKPFQELPVSEIVIETEGYISNVSSQVYSRKQDNVYNVKLVSDGTSAEFSINKNTEIILKTDSLSVEDTPSVGNEQNKYIPVKVNVAITENKTTEKFLKIAVNVPISETEKYILGYLQKKISLMSREEKEAYAEKLGLPISPADGEDNGQKPTPPDTSITFKNIISLLKDEIKNTKYENYDLDIKTLDEIQKDGPDNGIPEPESKEMKRLMDWGTYFCLKMAIEAQQDNKDKVWKKYTEYMNDLGVFVIYRVGVPFNKVDHIVFGGPPPAPGEIVKRVIRPGFKISAKAKKGQIGKIIKEAHVETELPALKSGNG